MLSTFGFWGTPSGRVGVGVGVAVGGGVAGVQAAARVVKIKIMLTNRQGRQDGIVISMGMACLPELGVNLASALSSST